MGLTCGWRFGEGTVVIEKDICDDWVLRVARFLARVNEKFTDVVQWDIEVDESLLVVGAQFGRREKTVRENSDIA